KSWNGASSLPCDGRETQQRIQQRGRDEMRQWRHQLRRSTLTVMVMGHGSDGQQDRSLGTRGTCSRCHRSLKLNKSLSNLSCKNWQKTWHLY
ncbi:hypothetical protein ABZP36_015313, partial [Zizania latifolia]